MSLTGKEVAQMHKDYVMQSWSKSGVDALPVEKAKGIYFWDYDGKKYADMASLLLLKQLRNRQIRCALWHRRMLQSQRVSLQRC